MKPTVACLGLAGLLAVPCRAAEPVDYLRDVKPMLAKHCVSCHGAVKPRGGLRLDTAEAALKGGKEGPAVLPGNSEESPLWLSVLGAGTSDRMPLKRPPLSEAQTATLRAWIDQGASHPAVETPSESGPTHWAFIAPRRPVEPTVNDPSWPRNAIDRFILARLEQARLAPAPEADRPTLIRRLSLDLLGLPPAPAEVAAFVADDHADAYERLVDRLLASPHYGERWGRPWLDQARYADSNGYSIDAPRSIWKYRDWVVDALNRDVPFDEFTIDQIAGDLRPHATLEQQVATGFHRNTQINQEGGIDVEQFRVDAIIDRVGTTASVFLGLTMGCAQCHDHKYDPISQREFYRFFAYFNNTDDPEVEFATPDELKHRQQVRNEIEAFHRKLAAEHPEFSAREREWEHALPPGYTAALPPELKDAFDRLPEKRTKSQERGLMELFLSRTPELKEWNEPVAALRRQEPKFVTTMVVRERGQPRETCVLVGGDFTRKGDRVAPGVPSVFPAPPSSAPANRLGLAEWLVAPENPLTARVQVNRVWQAYFGRGLVETDNDFGTQGTPPTHPELLDWLATEFRAQGWRFKALHRTIVTSATYRQSSKARPDAQTVDPQNRLLGRQERLRLDAELIRDSALAASGLLARRVGGPSVFPPQPDGVMKLGQMDRPWAVSAGADRYRRGLYTFFWRATPYPALMVFDAPNATQTCTRRARSNTPLQALTLLNDAAFYECAGALADRVLKDAPTDPERTDLAFRLCLARRPSPREAQALQTVLADERTEAAGTSDDATRAAWTTAARVLLNLDEFITRE